MLFLILGAVALAFVAPIVLTPLIGRSMLYPGTRVDPARLAGGAWQLARVDRGGGVVLLGLVRPPSSPEAPTVLMFGGNAISLADSKWILEMCARGQSGWGLAVFAYRGYDGSGGSPSQPALTADAEAVIAWLEATHGVRAERLAILGHSLGTGVAAHAAAFMKRRGTPPRALALVSPYTSMAKVFDEQVPVVPIGWIVPDPYRTDRLAAELAGPILLVHGDRDTLIGPHHSRELAKLLGERARHVELAGIAHGDIWDERTAGMIQELVAGAAPARAIAR